MQDSYTGELLVTTLERFVDGVLIPAEGEMSESDQIPASIVAQMREMDLFGLSIPREYGGLGLSMSDEVQVA